MKTTLLRLALAGATIALIASSPADAARRHHNNGMRYFRHLDSNPLINKNPAFAQGDSLARDPPAITIDVSNDDGSIISEEQGRRAPQAIIRHVPSPTPKPKTITAKSPGTKSSGPEASVSGGMIKLKEGGRVVAWAAAKFRGLFDDLGKMGFPVGDLHGACYSPGGHQWNSKHKWAGACDVWRQYDRNKVRMAHPSPSTQIVLAEKWGLESGCSWHRDRRGPDCGHFQVRGSTMAQFRQYVGGRYARRSSDYRVARRTYEHHRSRRVASR